MANENESPNGDPLVRSFDPFTEKHLQTPDELTQGINTNENNENNETAEAASHALASVEETGELPVAGTVPPPSSVVEAEPDSDMDLLGLDKR